MTASRRLEKKKKIKTSWVEAEKEKRKKKFKREREERDGVIPAMMINAGLRLIAELMKSKDLVAWRSSISPELAFLEANKTFDFVNGMAKISKTLISTRIILHKKLDERGEVESYKARLVAHRLRQRPGIDFDKTSALLVSIATVRLTLALLRSSVTAKHPDVTTAFLKRKVQSYMWHYSKESFLWKATSV